jgi:endonuclease YncB( thermonuclease family)
MRITEEATTMNYYKEKQELALTPIKNGWAAHGDGWAVHASTPEEAIQKFLEAEQRHKEIDKLPFWYEQFNAQLPHKDGHE